MSLECSFEDDYNCGYITRPYQSFYWERKDGGTWDNGPDNCELARFRLGYSLIPLL